MRKGSLGTGEGEHIAVGEECIIMMVGREEEQFSGELGLESRRPPSLMVCGGDVYVSVQEAAKPV